MLFSGFLFVLLLLWERSRVGLTRVAGCCNMAENINSIRVLAVDDDSFMRSMIERCLPAPDFETATCENALVAMQTFEKKVFDIVFLDVLMPYIDGLQLHKIIRTQNKLIPIVFLTAKAVTNEQLLENISQDGRTYYQNKQFRKDELAALVRRIIDKVRGVEAQKAYYAEMRREMEQASRSMEILQQDWVTQWGLFREYMFYRPYMNISGDLFYVRKLADGVLLKVICDISGHGIGAALMMSAVRVRIADFVCDRYGRSVRPHELLNDLQAFVETMVSGRYMTALVVIVDTNKWQIEYQSAGHPDCLLYSPGKNKFYDAPEGRGSLPVGLMPGTVYTEADNVQITDFYSKDVALFMFSDGILDIRNAAGAAVGDGDVLKQAIRATLSGRLLEPGSMFKIMEFLHREGYTDISDDVMFCGFSVVPLRDNEYRYEVMPNLEAVNDMVQRAYQLCVDVKKDEFFATKVELLLSEVLNNVVIHGLDKANSVRPLIALRLRFGDDALEIEMDDLGKRWDMGAVNVYTPSTEEEKKKDFRVSGRGISIMRTIARAITRYRYADKLNETYMEVPYKDEDSSF